MNYTRRKEKIEKSVKVLIVTLTLLLTGMVVGFDKRIQELMVSEPQIVIATPKDVEEQVPTIIPTSTTIPTIQNIVTIKPKINPVVTNSSIPSPTSLPISTPTPVPTAIPTPKPTPTTRPS